MALLLVLQGLLVSGGTMAYALDGDGGQTGGDAVRTEVRDWSSDTWLSEHGTLGGGALGITPTAQLAWDGEDVAERQLMETAFRALADDKEADVPATVTLSLKMDAPEGEVLLAGDTVSLSAQTDDGAVKLDDTAEAITLYEPDATGAATERAVASANVAGGKLSITLLESAFDAEEEAVALGADANATTEDQAIADEAATDQAVADDAAVANQATTEQAAARSADAQEQAAPAHGSAVAMVGTFEAAVDASALSADGADAAGAQHDWTLLAWNDQALSKATLVVPTTDQAVATLRDADALVEDKGVDETKDATAEAEDGVGDGTGDGDVSTLAAGDLNASYTFGGERTEQTITTVWGDNSSSSRPAADKVAGGYLLHFTLTSADGAVQTGTLSSNSEKCKNANLLGLVGDPADWPSWTRVAVTDPLTNEYVAMAGDLPSRMTATVTDNGSGDDLLSQTQTYYTIEWSLEDANTTDGGLYEGYLRTTDDTDPSKQYLQLLEETTFNVVGHIGGEELTSVFGESQKNDFRLYATAGNKTVEGFPADGLVLAEVIGATNPTVPGMTMTWQTPEGDATQGKLSGNLPAFTKDGTPIVYSIKYVGADEGNDYYQDVYDNAMSPNHGSDTTAAFPGGTLTLIHVGTTGFDATKQWLDDKPGERQELTFTIWRYSAQDEGGFAHAAQARLTPLNDDGTPGTGSAEFASVVASVEDIEEDGTIDLGALVEKKYGALPKYDSDGYPYIYALREHTTVDGYETVFGAVSVGEDGAVTERDTAPSYRGENDEPQYVGSDGSDSWIRPEADHFVYDRGTITNRKVGTVPLPLKKTWVAAAFQDQLGNVTCTFQAQSRPAGSNEAWEAVTNDDGEEVTKVMEGWYAEQLTQEVVQSFPKYDALGNELEYRWVEVSVRQGDGESQQLTENDRTFELNLKDALGEDVEITFESQIETDEETNATTIKNVFDNKTEQYVQKEWLNSDGKLIEGASLPNGQTSLPKVTVDLYRNQELVATFELTGEVDQDATGFELSGKYEDTKYECKVWEDAPWHLSITDLPEYSEDGEHYSYLVIEHEVEGWHTTRAYYPKGEPEHAEEQNQTIKPHTTVITNTLGEGESTVIPLSKTWLDDSDLEHRLPSVVGVYTAEGNSREVQAGLFMGYVVLTVDQGWYGELEVPGKWDWKTDFTWKEVGLAAPNTPYASQAVKEDATANNGVDSVPGADAGSNRETLENEMMDLVSSTRSGFPTYENAKEATETSELYEANKDWALKGWSELFEENAKHSRVATGAGGDAESDGHVYEIGYRLLAADADSSIEMQLPSLNTSNRRIGYIDLTIKKTWKDSIGDGHEDHARPTEAYFVPSETSGDVKFSVDDADGDGVGPVYAQLRSGGNKVPLFVDDGYDYPENYTIPGGATADSGNDPSVSRTQLKGKVSDDGSELLIEVDTKLDREYRINGLPKYNSQGEVAAYDLQERMEQDTKEGEDYYTSNRDMTEYEVGARHFHDQRTYAFDNVITGTKDVIFYKQWRDAYVNNVLGQRPDVSLTLYALQDDGTTVKAVEGFVQYETQPVPGHDGDTTQQQFVFSNLPKYDAEGNEIVYYATENVSANATALDYTDVKVIAPKTEDLPASNIEPLIDVTAQNPDSGATSGNADDAQNVETNPDSGTEPQIQTGSNWAVVENGIFENALADTVTVQGAKLWANVPTGFDVTDLSQISIYLQRRLVGQPGMDAEAEWEKLGVSQEKNQGAEGTVYAPVPNQDGWYVYGAVAWVDLFADDFENLNEWHFKMTHSGNNSITDSVNGAGDGSIVDNGDSNVGNDDSSVDGTESTLPQYDDKGNLYEYRTREAIWGLVGTPGGFEMDKVSDEDEGEGTTDDLTSNVYTVRHGETGSFLPSNSYTAADNGQLTVKKIFDGREPDKPYPDVTFTLYRQYEKESDTIGPDGATTETVMSNPVEVARKTITAEEFEAAEENGDATEDNSNTSVAATCTFDGLSLYAPNGKAWKYFVVENAIGGYTTQVGAGDLGSDDTFIDPSNPGGSSNLDVISEEELKKYQEAGLVVNGVASNRVEAKAAPSENDEPENAGSAEGENEGAVVDGDNAANSENNATSTVSFTFKNTYAPDTVSLQGKKSLGRLQQYIWR